MYCELLRSANNLTTFVSYAANLKVVIDVSGELHGHFHVCCRLQSASSSVNDRDVKDIRSEHPAVSSHSSLLKETEAKQRQLERNVRERPTEHVQRGHQILDRDDGRRDGSRRPSETELQHRQERRHSGSHHHHHHHQQHGSTKDDTVRHNRHTGRSVIM